MVIPFCVVDGDVEGDVPMGGGVEAADRVTVSTRSVQENPPSICELEILN